MFEKLFETRGVTTLDNPEAWLIDFLGGGITSSGEGVTKEGSLNISSVYACVNIRANAIAKMPMHVFKREGNKKERDYSHQVVDLIETRPNPYMTSFTFKHTASVHQDLWGNAYIHIETKRGFPVALWLLSPAHTKTYIDKSKNELWYITKINNKDYKFRSDEIIHLKSLSTDGLEGKSKITVARETIGNMKASTKLLGKFYNNGTTSGGVITYAEKLEKTAKDNIRKAWQEANTGLDNAGKVAILDMGLDYKSIGMNFEDAQFLQLNKFSLSEIARIFNVPLHLLNELDRATFNNIEQMSMEFIQNSIQPEITHWEQEFTYKLFTELERKSKGYYVKFNLASALRADSESRAKFYKEMFSMGAYSINEIRAYEDKNSIGDMGDKHFVSLNYTTLDNIEKYQLAKAGFGGENVEK